MPRIAKTAGGPRGPVPKLIAERRRRNGADGPKLLTLPAGEPLRVPAADPAWHPVIIAWFEGLRSGPEGEFLTAAGWGFVRYLAERESRNLQLARPSAQTSALFVAAQSDLLTTEGARRRLRIELERPVPRVAWEDSIVLRALRGGHAS
jgi:hypothetical protein